MKKYLLYFLLAALSFFFGWILNVTIQNKVPNLLKSITKPVSIEKPLNLQQYSIGKLSETSINPGKLKIIEIISEKEHFISYLFEFEFNPDPTSNEFKKTTGQINLPAGRQVSQNIKYPIVVMLRGYIDQDTFTTGDGTRRAAEVFAKEGFITIAPDFLGYGGSDDEAGNIFESRFQTYVTTISLLKTLNSIAKDSSLIYFSDQLQPKDDWLLAKFNHSSIFFWAHSNGGQIALTTLEITGAKYPTTLWAPVSKPFPYSVLYYTDQSMDEGKLIRSELSKFEENHDVKLYSLTNDLDKINAPLQIQQGTSDDAVPIAWSKTLVNKLQSLKKDITYYEYLYTDHNMRPSWDLVASRDLEFFKKHLTIDN